MAHRPAARYAPPKALAEDVEQWMADEPVSSWSEPWTRTLMHWLTRHRVGVTAAGAAVLVALAGTGAGLAVQTRANAHLTRAGCDRAIAIREDLVKGDPTNADFAQGLAESLMRSGTARAAAGDVAGAAADWRRAAGLYAAHPPVVEAAIFRACCHGGLAGLAGQEGPGITAAEAASQAEEAMAILRGAFAGGYRDIDSLRVEPGLEPLRRRDDFRRLMMDLDFPVEPFAVRLDADDRPVPNPR